ncbi:hypothetical protein DFP72DRAFT_841052 [Ephemerocybe angulata]|uniref:F-box domain-containing protein n=1 Tax=Ephemerocybe angulata TaxID=980116 RepID=A0A8H6MGP2_9AGAR|nr:hypothetical protein DFP72DRAFT_841052 [Tulosesus angulatus]
MTTQYVVSNVPPVAAGSKVEAEGSKSIIEQGEFACLALQMKPKTTTPQASVLSSTPSILEPTTDVRAVEENRQLNAATPVGRLPPEILTNIFLLVDPWPFFGRGRIPAAFALSYVCREWMTIATGPGCAALWADLRKSYHPELANLMVSRSRDAPMSIVYFQPKVEHEEALRFIVNRDLDFDMEWVFSNFVSEAPMLEHLHIEASPERWTRFPDNFLQGGAPYLMDLQLRNCNILWSQIPFSAHLTNLQLWDHLDSERSWPTIEMLMDALKLMPLLYTIEFRGILPSKESSPPLPPYSRTVLRDLHTITLWEPMLATIDFFKYLSINPSATVDLWLTGPVRETTTIARLLSNVRAALEDAEISCSTPLRVHGLEISFRIDGRCGPWEDDPGQYWNFDIWTQRDRGPSISVALDPGWLDPIEFVAQFRAELNLSTLERLQFTEFEPLPSPAWITMFGQLPRLKAITVSCTCEFQDFFLALSTKRPTQAGDTTATSCPTFYFAALETITLDVADFGSRPTRRTNLICVIHALKERSKTNPIKELRLERCPEFLRMHYELLKSADIDGLDLIWDEDESGELSYSDNSDSDSVSSE